MGGHTISTSLNQRLAIVRLTSSGKLDNTYNSNGIKILNELADCSSIKVNLIEDIIATGETNQAIDFGIINTNTNGSLNTNFNTTGIDSFSVGHYSSAINTHIQKTDNKIILVGNSYDGTNYSIVLAILNTNGSLDNGFNTNGKVVIDENAYFITNLPA